MKPIGLNSLNKTGARRQPRLRISLRLQCCVRDGDFCASKLETSGV